MTLIALSFLLSSLSLFSDAYNMCPLIKDHFSYNPHSHVAPYHWASLAKCCGSKFSQSPRNLDLESARYSNDVQLKLKNFHLKRDGIFYNNGHSANWAVSSKKAASVTIGDGNTYNLAGVHFHFGDGKTPGSEHALNGKRFDGEMHMVHFNAKYGSVANAVLYEDGLLVIGAFLEATRSQGNKHLSMFIKHAAQFTGIGTDKGVKVVQDVASLIPQHGKHITYHGSLTTPPCSESVRWIVLAKPQAVSEKAFQALRNLPNDEGKKIASPTNARPLQENGTPIYHN